MGSCRLFYYRIFIPLFCQSELFPLGFLVSAISSLGPRRYGHFPDAHLTIMSVDTKQRTFTDLIGVDQRAETL